MTPRPSTTTGGESSRAGFHQFHSTNKPAPATKLTKEGSAFLTNYARTISSYPSRSEKFDILESVQAIPGNESFTFEKLTSWFSRHRNPAHAPPHVRTGVSGTGAASPLIADEARQRAPGGRILVDDDSICGWSFSSFLPSTRIYARGTTKPCSYEKRKQQKDSCGNCEIETVFPKLTSMHLQQLRVLYKKRPDPTEGIITFWANRLNADRAEVAAWIQYEREKAKEGASESPDLGSRHFGSTSASVSPTFPNSARPHLPTPSKSASPEMRRPSLPPITVKVEESGSQMSTSFVSPTLLVQRPSSSSMHFPSYESPVLTELPPLKRGAHAMQHPPQPEQQAESQSQQRPPAWASQNALLVASIRNSSRSGKEVDEKAPATAEDFVSRFGPIEKQINGFINKLEGGQLASLGWDPSESFSPRYGGLV
ncbi:hypothetical protein PAXRUDRAFT_463891 [Paxillus rubicundulus Ve08.2h10]|uniref:Unplaced genomic scaffold scaffold_3, whole genome shotgun sequence n=1 Tax=Paxillus rubicundulus Ve08.2h10 TaxID=930991 RepID=A0A0D0EB24_9AGAM|nr:hypothetical protein PAXRUDRAFT_463891 [Paxillus rubicundulus Ve08.2h10]